MLISVNYEILTVNHRLLLRAMKLWLILNPLFYAVCENTETIANQ